jgi:hypothetical protein
MQVCLLNVRLPWGLGYVKNTLEKNFNRRNRIKRELDG